jgi:hypothetical protein
MFNKSAFKFITGFIGILAASFFALTALSLYENSFGSGVANSATGIQSGSISQ